MPDEALDAGEARRATQRATNGSHGSPAWTSRRTRPPPASARSIPRVATRTTVPGKPASATTTLLPPARTSSGSPARSARRTAATSASSSAASTSRPAGPPRRSVVRSRRSVGVEVSTPAEATTPTGRVRAPRVEEPTRMRRPPAAAAPAPPAAPGRPSRSSASSACSARAWLWLRDSPLVAVRARHRHRRERPRRPGGSARRSSDAARDMTTLHVSAGELRTAVDPYPTVLDVSTHADFPHGLRIAVHERNPVGAVVAGDAARSGRRRRHAHAHDAERRPAGDRGQGAPRRLARQRPRRPPRGRACCRPRRPPCARACAACTWATAAGRCRCATARSSTSAAPSAWRRSGRRSAPCSPTRRSTGATYLDVRLPERPAAGGLEPPPEDPRTRRAPTTARRRGQRPRRGATRPPPTTEPMT